MIRVITWMFRKLRRYYKFTILLILSIKTLWQVAMKQWMYASHRFETKSNPQNNEYLIKHEFPLSKLKPYREVFGDIWKNCIIKIAKFNTRITWLCKIRIGSWELWKALPVQRFHVCTGRSAPMCAGAAVSSSFLSSRRWIQLTCLRTRVATGGPVYEYVYSANAITNRNSSQLEQRYRDDIVIDRNTNALMIMNCTDNCLAVTTAVVTAVEFRLYN